MATTTTQPAVSDPECLLVGAGHTCMGRGGKRITADNGVACFAGAQVGAMREAA